jgi:hypothetical protein
MEPSIRRHLRCRGDAACTRVIEPRVVVRELREHVDQVLLGRGSGNDEGRERPDDPEEASESAGRGGQAVAWPVPATLKGTTLPPSHPHELRARGHGVVDVAGMVDRADT